MHIKLKTDQLLNDDDECRFAGSVTVDIPSFPERQKFAATIGLEHFSDIKEADDMEAKIKKRLKMTEVAASAAEKVLERVVDCDLVSDDGEHLKTKEEFACHPDATPLVEGLVMKFMTNFASKKTKPLPTGK